MTTEQIKQAVDQGKRVHWENPGYLVIKDSIGQYLIKCLHSNHCIGLTHQDGETLNGREDQFFIGE